ncbi:hypothetical protein KC363_g4023 [Hortaea werneckii]|uniref:Ketoreductase domain-containing protein n=1 Tax=Hortaea werneckii TaxID=91943 RepID=A0A3M7FQH2_HORWE|nr:hypothetical protein KC325_g4260 [Hortaea werneckii]KAI6993923.1 hypothetical protein KC359_g4889 [Hortaea werneckii]KAI7142649.1 hypothetical protein KC344_g7015 [Hortaea werneckii]KAI7174660.1 hypothetical protein KC360_g4185 [Hortaea werneckii]KAI7191163.1 hypothetical protein KC363_g4023 [Hortaea werneckii]
MPSLDLTEIPRPVETYHRESYFRILPSNFNYDNKTVLITGGSSGIGYAIAKTFAVAGARVVIISRSPGQLQEARRNLQAFNVLAYPASISDETRMKQVFDEVGQIDILLLNAAYIHDFGPTDQLQEDQMQESFDTNVIAQWKLVKAFIDLPMPSSGIKTVINISTAGIHLALPHQAAYIASKTAFVQLCQHLATEHTPKEGFRVFSMHPGAIYTPAVAKNMGRDDFPWEDVNLAAGFCLWLASGQADFLHGRFVWAQWDVDELIALKDRVVKEPIFLQMGLVM